MRLTIRALVVLGLAFLTACYAPEPQKEFKGKKQFRTTDPSRLYFKNMRSAYYYRSRRPNSKKDIYKLRKASKEFDRPLLYPVIINDWLNDEAFVFIEKNNFKDFHTDSLIVQWQEADTTGTFFMTTPTKEAQYAFAGEIYDALTKGKSLEMKTKNGGFVSIFQRQQDAMNFVIVMRDYYRLTEVK